MLIESTEIHGFIIDKLGAHLGRTIMTEEVTLLFSASDANASAQDYRKAILDDNVLLKPTAGSKAETNRRLRQLYSLDPSVLVFRVLRELWNQPSSDQNLLALLCALARDPVLRSTTDLVINTSYGNTLTAKDFEQIVAENFPGRLNPKTQASAGRNLASSWVQSGHFHRIGTEKTRQRIEPDAMAVVYALFLAYLSGYRGDGLFASTWLRLLDASTHQLHNLAQQASQQGWLEYRHAGQVTEITFRHFMEKHRE